MVKITIDTSEEIVAQEIGYGIIGRAQQIHENPDDDFEHVAIELRDIGQRVLEEHSDESFE